MRWWKDRHWLARILLIDRKTVIPKKGNLTISNQPHITKLNHNTEFPLWIYPDCLSPTIWKYECTKLFTEYHLSLSSMRDWLNKWWYIHTMEYNAAVKQDLWGALYADTGWFPGNIITEKSRIQKKVFSVLIFM